MARKKLIDPVDDQISKNNEAAELAEAEQSFDLANISMADLGRIPQKTTRAIDPFDGYPFKKIKVDENIGERPAAHIVVLDPNVYVFQDPSGLGLTVKDTKTGQERRQDLKTYHNRCVIDSRGQNINVVFDREINIGDGRKAHFALVPDNAARSQICFKLDQKGKVHTDTRYLLLDTDQASRLRKVFDNVHYQQLKGERSAIAHETQE